MANPDINMLERSRKMMRIQERNNNSRIMDYTLEIILERDKEIRENDFDRNSGLISLENCASEQDIVQYILINQLDLKIFQDYPYLIEHQYMLDPPRSQDGEGDLIFTDGNNHFLVVEVKYLRQSSWKNSGRTTRSRNRKSRRHLEEQAIKYGKHFFNLFPNSHVKIIGATNHNLLHLSEKL